MAPTVYPRVFTISYDFPLWDVIEHDEVTEHGDEAYQSQSRHNVDDSILQTELSWKLGSQQAT